MHTYVMGKHGVESVTRRYFALISFLKWHSGRKGAICVNTAIPRRIRTSCEDFREIINRVRTEPSLCCEVSSPGRCYQFIPSPMPLGLVPKLPFEKLLLREDGPLPKLLLADVFFSGVPPDSVRSASVAFLAKAFSMLASLGSSQSMPRPTPPGRVPKLLLLRKEELEEDFLTRAGAGGVSEAA